LELRGTGRESYDSNCWLDVDSSSHMVMILVMVGFDPLQKRSNGSGQGPSGEICCVCGERLKLFRNYGPLEDEEMCGEGQKRAKTSPIVSPLRANTVTHCSNRIFRDIE